jgi:hypothetical protein
MQKEIEKWLSDLKTIRKIPTAAVEKAIGVSNGLLGKAAKGKTVLSQDKVEKLREYHSFMVIQAKEQNDAAVAKVSKSSVLQDELDAAHSEIKALKKQLAIYAKEIEDLKKNTKISVKNLTVEAPKSNYAIESHGLTPMSNFMMERMKKAKGGS